MRVVVAEDSVLFREGLVRLLLEKGHDVVATVGDADSLRKAVAETSPDLAIIDIRMPPMMGSDGAEAAVSVRATIRISACSSSASTSRSSPYCR